MSCLLGFLFLWFGLQFSIDFFFLLVLPFSLVYPCVLSRQSPLTCIASSALNSSSAPHTRYCLCVVIIMILSLANVCLLHSFIKLFYVFDVIVVGTSYFNVVVWMNTMGKREVPSLFVCSFGWILGIPTILLFTCRQSDYLPPIH